MPKLSFSERDDLVLKICEIYFTKYEIPQTCSNIKHTWQNIPQYFKLWKSPYLLASMNGWCNRCLKEQLKNWTNFEVIKIIKGEKCQEQPVHDSMNEHNY